MFPRMWTGVTKKDDKLIYTQRGALFRLLGHNQRLVISEATYCQLKKVVICELLLAVMIIIYFKEQSPLSYLMLIGLLILGLVLDSISGYIKNQLVKRSVTDYEKQR